jgi:truncated hemoglobin YjbI
MLFVLLTLFAVALSTQSKRQDDSICDKYSAALKLNNSALVTTVVTGVVGKLLDAKSINKKYFDGTKPPGSTDYTTNQKAAAELVGSLVAFFGSALGCSDGTIGQYQGAPMDKVHQPMGINVFESIAFNDAVVAVLAAAGVDEMDQVAVRILLNSLKVQIVKQGSICDRYSKALQVSNKELVSTVITGVFTAITSDGSPILKYFNGQKPPGSMNFLSPKNKMALDGLANGLVAFFGTALMCSDETVPPYGGAPLKAVHKLMKINENEFNFFNVQVLQVLRNAGVAAPDLAAVTKLLNSTKSDIVTV